MRLCLLSGASTIHTIRWANGLCAAGVEVHLISQHPLIDRLDPNVHLHIFPHRGTIGYFTMVPELKRILNNIQPDLINAHYASGYATAARLTGFHPWLLNVWGSDVYDVPNKSIFHRWWIIKNLMAADQVASTSQCMAEQIRSICPVLKRIHITPFGVDVDCFAAAANTQAKSYNKDSIVIGTIKTLSPKYGVDTLLRAFSVLRARLRSNAPELADRLRLRIVGDGPDHNKLVNLAKAYGISEISKFVGRVPYKDIPREFAKLDIFVALSRYDSESFGVAVIEAGAAGKPVVVSSVGGLPEVVMDNETGFIVPPDNHEAAADALERLVNDESLRQKMGKAGYHHVARKYGWKYSIETMIQALRATTTIH